MSVLVAYDGSEPAQKALDHAFEKHANEEMLVVYVSNPVDPGTVDEMMFPGKEGYRDQVRAQGEELLKSARERPEAENMDLDTQIVVGSPDEEIVASAEENNVDHIIIGSHGRSGVSRVLLGSVAEKVVRRSPVPVTVVR